MNLFHLNLVLTKSRNFGAVLSRGGGWGGEDVVKYEAWPTI
jgi:hypothetical protein